MARRSLAGHASLRRGFKIQNEALFAQSVNQMKIVRLALNAIYHAGMVVKDQA